MWQPFFLPLHVLSTNVWQDWLVQVTLKITFSTLSEACEVLAYIYELEIQEDSGGWIHSYGGNCQSRLAHFRKVLAFSV